MAAVFALLVPLVRARKRRKPEPTLRHGFKRFNAVVIHQNGIARIAPADFPKTMSWYQASQALCAAAQTVQDPGKYKLLDVRKLTWLDKPATIKELKADSIALVEIDFAATLQNDPHLIATIMQSSK